MTTDEIISDFKSEMDKMRDRFIKSINLLGSSSADITSKQFDTINRYSVDVLKRLLEQHDGQSLLEKVRQYLKETPREQVLADWDATSYIEGGITVDEYLASLQPAPFHSMNLDDIADEIESELVRYATEESEYWHHWRIGVMDGLKKAQSMMPAPVYHYLPEVPEDWENVICYVENLDFGVEAIYRSMSEYKLPSYFETRDGNYIKPYAWMRIPPKPPVKPTEEQP